MKKIDSIEEALGLVVKDQKGRSKSRGPKRNPEISSSFSYYFCNKPAHIKKNYMKYKEMLKKKGGKNSDGASGKTDQAGIIEQADEHSFDILTAVRKM